jgi:hypothetical protein
MSELVSPERYAVWQDGIRRMLGTRILCPSLAALLGVRDEMRAGVWAHSMARDALYAHDLSGALTLVESQWLEIRKKRAASHSYLARQRRSRVWLDDILTNMHR